MSATPAPFPPGLYALCDDTVRPDLSLREQARALLEGGVSVMQLRAKQTVLREWVAQAREVAAECRRRGVICLINDRADLARVCGAHGVHLGDEDLAPADARHVLPAGAIVGVTVRNAEEARAAREAGADYVGLGPVFSTRTKDVPSPVLGLERFARIVQECPLPVVGIGGIGLGALGDVARAGAHGAAVVSDLLRAPDIAARARALQAEFEEGRRR